MRIRIGKAVSFNLLGNILILAALLFFVTSILRLSITAVSTAVILVIIGYIVKREGMFIIFRSPKAVTMLIQNTLNLLKLSFTQEYAIFTLDKVEVKIKVIKVGFFSVLQFRFTDKNSQSEKYIADTVVKYQR